MAISINPYGTPKSLTNNVYEMLLKLIILNHWTFRPQWFARMLGCCFVRAKRICCIKNVILLVQPKSHHLVIFITFLRGGCCVKTHKCPLYLRGLFRDCRSICTLSDWEAGMKKLWQYQLLFQLWGGGVVECYTNIISVIFYVGSRD